MTIPAAGNGGHRMERNALHLAARPFMMIALPNLDGTFTARLPRPCRRPGFDVCARRATYVFRRHLPGRGAPAAQSRREFFANPTGVS
jgi:hypothetical protein